MMTRALTAAPAGSVEVIVALYGAIGTSKSLDDSVGDEAETGAMTMGVGICWTLTVKVCARFVSCASASFVGRSEFAFGRDTG